jgi:hypothetical protein
MAIYSDGEQVIDRNTGVSGTVHDTPDGQEVVWSNSTSDTLETAQFNGLLRGSWK